MRLVFSLELLAFCASALVMVAWMKVLFSLGDTSAEEDGVLEEEVLMEVGPLGLLRKPDLLKGKVIEYFFQGGWVLEDRCNDRAIEA